VLSIHKNFILFYYARTNYFYICSYLIVSLIYKSAYESESRFDQEGILRQEESGGRSAAYTLIREI